jgi:hypothetical protein
MPYIDESTEYQFVKFKDGKEIFAMVREVFTNDKLELHFPMNIQLQPAMTGGVLLHLGPYIPFTKEDSITVDTNSVLFRTSISKKFISFYDEACSAWLNIRENDRMEIKSGRQVFEEQREVMEGMIKRRFEEGELDFRDEIGDMLEEFEEQKYLETGKDEGPGPDDTIH